MKPSETFLLRLRQLRQRYAYVHRNAEKLTFEDRIILIGHALTCVFCFFPWLSAEPFSREWTYRNAFAGETWLIGSIVFVLSAAVVALYLDTLFDTRRIQIPVPRTTATQIASAQSLMCIIIGWSVLLVVSRTYSDSELRFGIAACFVCQVLAGVSSYLLSQKSDLQGAEIFRDNSEQA